MYIKIRLHKEMLLPIAKGLRTAIENELKSGWDYPIGLQSVELIEDNGEPIPIVQQSLSGSDDKSSSPKSCPKCDGIGGAEVANWGWMDCPFCKGTGRA